MLGGMRSGYVKYKCRLCGEIYVEDFQKDVIDKAWREFDNRASDVPILHGCSKTQTGFSDLVGYIICSEGNGW